MNNFISPPQEQLLQQITHQIKPSADSTLLRVNCNAMEGAGISEGDIIVVDKKESAISGRVIVAVVDGSLIIRRLYTNGFVQRLIPDSDSLAPLDILPGCSFAVWGVVVMVIKQVN